VTLLVVIILLENVMLVCYVKNWLNRALFNRAFSGLLHSAPVRHVLQQRPTNLTFTDSVSKAGII